MVNCETMADIEAADSRLSQADYAARLPALRRARDVAASTYTDVYVRGARTLLAQS
jgi:hypothetical protein